MLLSRAIVLRYLTTVASQIRARFSSHVFYNILTKVFIVYFRYGDIVPETIVGKLIGCACCPAGGTCSGTSGPDSPNKGKCFVVIVMRYLWREN